jgi:hypothetical protein
VSVVPLHVAGTADELVALFEDDEPGGAAGRG